MMKYILFMMIMLFSLPSYGAEFLLFIFPMLKPAPQNAALTMEAPFMTDEERALAEQSRREAVSEEGRLAGQHRPDREITEWLERNIPIIFSIQNGDTEKSRGQFSDIGWYEFNRFIQNTDFNTYMNNPDYQINTIVTDIPYLEKKDSASGLFYWLYEIPIKASYINKSLIDYRSENVLKGDEYILAVLVRRATQADNEHNIVIERIQRRSERRQRL